MAALGIQAANARPYLTGERALVFYARSGVRGGDFFLGEV